MATPSNSRQQVLAFALVVLPAAAVPLTRWQKESGFEA